MDTASPTDHALLTQYLAEKSDEAFGRLVARHGGFVRAVALRRVRGDHHLAEDVTQAVFIVLTRRATAANRSASLRGWLHATTCFAASNALRAAARRAKHEAKVEPIDATALADDPAALAASADEWAVIDAALCGLRAKDRDALMLHYVEGLPLDAVGRSLGTTGEGAKKRVQRARDRLRVIIHRRGHSTSVTDKLSALAIVPMTPDLPMLAGGADGRAFVIARQVISSLKLQAAKTGAAIALAASLAIATVAIVAAQPRSLQVPQSAAVVPASNGALPNPVAATIGDDVRVELIGVFANSDPTHWWLPDGTPLAEPAAAGVHPLYGSVPPPKPGDIEDLGVVFRVTHTRPKAQLDMEMTIVPYSMLWAGHTGGTMTYTLPIATTSRSADAMPTSGPTSQPDAPMQTIFMVQISALEYLTNCDLRLSVAPSKEPWQTMEAIGVDGEVVGDVWALRLWNRNNAGGRSTDREGAYISWGTPVERDGEASVEVFDDFAFRDRTVVAVDRNGVEHEPAAPQLTRTIKTSPATTSTVVQTQLTRRPYQQVDEVRHYATRAHYPGLKLADVERFELRMRERPALLFSEVALAPNVHTNARVGPAEPPIWSRTQPPPPADAPIAGVLRFDGERLDEAVERIAERSGTRIYVHWEWLKQLQRGGPEHSVPAITLTRPTPEIALRAVFAAASFDDIAVVVSDDGKTIRVLSGNRMLRGDGRAWLPGKIR